MDIRLAPWSMEDAEALAFLMDRADRRYLSDRLPKPYTLENARWWLEMVAKQEGKTGLFRKILVDGHVVGNISAEGQEDIYRKDAVLGYVLDKEQWGRGIMSRAVALFCPLVFDRLDVLRLSARVLETQSLTDLTGLPFTEEPKRAKEWDNYLELARRMEDALAADGLR